MSERAFPPYTVGIDHVSDDTALPTGAVRDAVNVAFDRDGRVRRRPGRTLGAAGDTHSLWSTKDQRRAFCIRGSDLCRVSLLGTAASAVPLATLTNALPTSYAEITGKVIASNPSWIGVIDEEDNVLPLGVEDGRLGTLAPAAAGGMTAGRYGVAVAYLRGDEQGVISYIRFVDVPEGGGITVTIPPALDPTVTAARVYRTTPGGDVLYRADDAFMGVPFLVGNSPTGRPIDSARLRQMPPGSIVRAWQGRLLVARGRTLCISEPMRYGVYSPITGFIQEPQPIDMVAPVRGGVFVGTREGVVFYGGDTPKDWKRTRLGTTAPIPHSDRLIDLSVVGPRYELGQTGEAAMWLSHSGFVIGQPDGSLMQPQERRIRLTAQRGQLAIVGRQAISLVF